MDHVGGHRAKIRTWYRIGVEECRESLEESFNKKKRVLPSQRRNS